jgi:hypothetical protein
LEKSNLKLNAPYGGRTNTMKHLLIQLAQATLAAAIIGLPFAIYFWQMKP